MRKLNHIRKSFVLIVCCFFYLYSHAQVIPQKIEGKPSYKETVEFIKTSLALPLFSDGLDGGYSPVKGIYLKRMYKIKEFTFADCVMAVRYEIEETTSGLGGANQQPKIESFSALIDFSKVESMSWIAIGEQYCLIGLKFNIKGLSKNSKIELPINRIECLQPTKWNELNELQIYKAFEHLRKMCGAPDPLKF